jgi:ABC-type sugar transport system substrate-binding protein
VLAAQTSGDAAGTRFTIALIPGLATDAFSLTLRKGAPAAAAALGDTLRFQAVPESKPVVASLDAVIARTESLKARGVGVVFISHNPADIFAVADRIVVLRRGVAVGKRPRSATEPDEVVRMMIG